METQLSHRARLSSPRYDVRCGRIQVPLGRTCASTYEYRQGDVQPWGPQNDPLMDALIPMCWDGGTPRPLPCQIRGHLVVWQKGTPPYSYEVHEPSASTEYYSKLAATVGLLVFAVLRLKVNSRLFRPPQEENFTHGAESKGAGTNMDPSWGPIPAAFNVWPHYTIPT